MSKVVKGTGRTKKLSEIVAAQLMEEIRDRGWPVGESLGTESELMTRFSVSRATMAEAVRQVERYGAAIMRRGSGGGLVVSNSARAALSRTISTYLELSNASLSEQYEAARLIEMQAAMLAAEHITEEQVVTLRQAALAVSRSEDNLGLHRAAMQLRLEIANVSGNRPGLLFARTLARVLTHYVRPDLRTQYRDREFEHGVAADLSGVVEAIVAGNGARAAHFVRVDVERRELRARELAVAQPLLEGGPLRRETPNKMAEKVAYAIRDDIARMGWQVGERLGDEADLPERYGVSPWVLRQGIRILEPSGIVNVRRGQGGGIYIGRPSPEHTIESAASYLISYRDGTGIPLDGYFNLRRSIYQEIAGLASKRATLKEREDLVSLAGQEEADSAETEQAFWVMLGVMGRNQVLALFGAILTSFVADTSEGSAHAADKGGRMAIAAAVRDGDAPLAERRMRTYLYGGRPGAAAEPESAFRLGNPLDTEQSVDQPEEPDALMEGSNS